jgi:pimeloyl-ACP methyl ester carboxylesterase
MAGTTRERVVGVERFVVDVPQSTLDDLGERLARTRWPPALDGGGWEDGTSLAFLRELVGWWQTGFDWRAQEAAINRFAQFRATVGGVRLHFVHVRGQGPAPLPLVLTHGWPSTFYELLPLVPLLTDPASHGGDPADAFDVVIPSLPGYGFSDPLQGRGSANRVPALWAQLMSEVLGYERFGAHGGDIGAMVANRLALEHPERLVGPRHPPRRPLRRIRGGAAHRGRAGPAARPGPLARGRGRLCASPADPPPDPGLRPGRLAGRAGRLDPGEMAGLERLRR